MCLPFNYYRTCITNSFSVTYTTIRMHMRTYVRMYDCIRHLYKLNIRHNIIYIFTSTLAYYLDTVLNIVCMECNFC